VAHRGVQPTLRIAASAAKVDSIHAVTEYTDPMSDLSSVAHCGIDFCGVLAVARCGRCRRAFCGGHKGGQPPLEFLRDERVWCGECTDSWEVDWRATESRKQTQQAIEEREAEDNFQATIAAVKSSTTLTDLWVRVARSVVGFRGARLPDAVKMVKVGQGYPFHHGWGCMVQMTDFEDYRPVVLVKKVSRKYSSTVQSFEGIEFVVLPRSARKEPQLVIRESRARSDFSLGPAFTGSYSLAGSVAEQRLHLYKAARATLGLQVI
jgi:hypothetical protein